MDIFSNASKTSGKQSSIGDHLRSMASDGALQALNADAQERLIGEVKAMSHSAQSTFFSHLSGLSGEQLKSIGEGADPTLFYSEGESRPQEYTVRRGDSLSRIAASHKVSLAQLIAANPQIDNPDLIHPDQIIKLP
jgi:LysM repeat protein